MAILIHSEEGNKLRQLIPLATLPLDHFETICRQVTLEKAIPGEFLFKRFDTDDQLIFLVDGCVSLQSGELKTDTITSGTDTARFALAHQIPRKIDACVLTPVCYIKIQPDLLNTNQKPHNQEKSNFMVIDEPEEEIMDDDDDWMTTLLKSPIFRALPPANLQQILIGLEEIAYEKGDSIIKQGDPGDYYYLIKKGHCLVSRKPSPNAKEIKLAQLRAQDTFGEDSLLSGAPRNVNITALTEVVLLRLDKERFINLIKKPSLKYIPQDQIKALQEQGYLLLDVRPPDDYKKHHLPNSTNTPFFFLRMQIKTFDKKQPVIVVCNDGKTSEAAAFLLLRHNIQAAILQGGMDAIKPEPASQATSGEQGLTESNTILSTTEDTSLSEPELRAENQKLKVIIEQLMEEKKELERKYLTLYKQSQKMKAILDSISNNNGN